MLDVDEQGALEAASFDGAEDQSIDFFLCDDVNERIVVLQAHYPLNSDKATKKSKWDALLSAIPVLESPSTLRDAGRTELASAVEEARPHIGTFDAVLGLVSLGEHSDQIARALATARKSTSLKNYSFFYDSKAGVLDGYSAVKSGDRAVPEDTIALSGGYFEEQGAYGTAYVGTTSAAELKRLYREHQKRLFAGNVRYFLGTRVGGINEQIVKTAREQPRLFWALNNGISIVADTVVPLAEGRFKENRFKLTRFSIVNGCQTTVCVSRADASVDAKVLVRLIAANRGVVGDIVRYNNTQNAVKIWAVRAVDAVQLRLRDAFEREGITYAPKPEGSRQLKSSEVISLDRLAQFLGARSAETLISAVKEKSELFDRHYQELFPHNVTPEDVYLSWLLGIQSDALRQERLTDLKQQGDADSTMTSFLGVGGAYWIVHCANKLVADLNRAPLNVSLKQMNADQFRGAVKKYCAQAIDIYIDIAINTFDIDEYKSVRSALRSLRFLQRFDQKLANKVAAMRRQRHGLPNLGLAARSAAGRAG
ncbi:AIPR family protein [Sorangium sp. So ce204]|uniref:AIPR family protein n=1 Tax=Sorangium sp. So ce204 TaxID=3133288 RepID=UPI003F5E9967